ncbi:MAG: Re/Si-specific NAD(P)(+) transhydrogenase subunit alpha [Candidatus Schekmanbacteria bacterium]|nr:Re/Si-specific NAD(P)(+) transhydrogenase subunit alpha [Candidatus Schekmanbacteria bacterium]
MKIAVRKETRPGERRVALVPESCKKLVQKGIEVCVEPGAGDAALFFDPAYEQAGARLESGAASSADLVAAVQPPAPDEVGSLREGAMLLASVQPVRAADAVRALLERKISILSTDFIPRITRAQSMDTLSSMASIAGYKAVLLAANELSRHMPMLMTAAGTILPARVFVIGAGVAGLQAIATAKRLGGSVTATDTRKAVAEQIQSVGAKFVGVDSDEDAQTQSGYAKDLSQEFYRKQAELIAKQCAQSDVVITTALIGGVKAPKLISAAAVRDMQPGSVIVDLASEAGGNCELTRPGETVVERGVKIIGPLNLASTMPKDASTLFSRNLTTFILNFWKDAEKQFNLDLADEIIKGCLLTHQGEVLHGPTRDLLARA